MDLSLIVPFYNEQENVAPLMARLLEVLRPLGMTFEIVCIDDGSSDGTLAQLLAQQRLLPQVVVLEFSRNFGKEAALTAGLEYARGDAVIPLDSDLQDPPELIPEMVAQWRRGFEVVLAQRGSREQDTRMKRLTAHWFYRIHNQMTDTRIPNDVGDFRLMDRVVVEAVNRLEERQRFMKGIFSWAGFRQTTVLYDRAPRRANATKWNYWRLWNFALGGIFSFSTLPLRIWTYLGLLVASLSMLYALFIIGKTLYLGVDVPGYASLMVVILIIGGLQFVSLGILGEYIGHIHQEVKRRPVYILRRCHSVAAPVAAGVVNPATPVVVEKMASSPGRG